jgi:hypothetical protein
MEDNIIENIARQGLGHIIALTRCPDCNYIAQSDNEETMLARRDQACPRCGIVGCSAGLVPSNYLDVANWIGEYAASGNRRDQASAVFLFCAFVEAILEILKEDYVKLHPGMKLKFSSDRQVSFKDVFGATFKDSLSAAPDRLKKFPSVWEELRDKRNRFLHGKSSYFIGRLDAHNATNSTVDAVNVYRWLNNKHCVKPQSTVLSARIS